MCSDSLVIGVPVAGVRTQPAQRTTAQAGALIMRTCASASCCSVEKNRPMSLTSSRCWGQKHSGTEGKGQSSDGQRMGAWDSTAWVLDITPAPCCHCLRTTTGAYVERISGTAHRR